MSNFRDLLFNYTEHTYDFIKIKKLLESKKLNFIAFNEMNPNVTKLFKTHFPNENDEVNLNYGISLKKFILKLFLVCISFG